MEQQSHGLHHGEFDDLFVDVNNSFNFGQNRQHQQEDMGIARFEHSKRPSPSLENLFSNRDVLAKRLKNRPAKENLVDRNIIPAHQTSPGIYDKVAALERKKTGDYLLKKIRARPSRQQLIQRHILSDHRVDPSLLDNINRLERQKIADHLNERLLSRPGPIELIQDRILPVESPIQNAVENFEDTLSPTSSGAPSVSELESNLDTLNSTSASPPSLYHHTQDIFTSNKHVSTESKHKQLRQVSSEPNISKLTISQNFSLSNRENEKLVRSMYKKPKPTKPKVKKLKFHECRPPDMPIDLSGDNPVDERYQRLLEQQTLYLRLQVMQQNAMLNALQGNPESMDAVTEEIESVISKEKKNEQSTLQSIEGKKLDELRVIDLRAHLKQRGLLVSGSKATLIQRLINFEQGKSTAADYSYSGSSDSQKMTSSNVTTMGMPPATTMMQVVTTYASDATGQTYQVVQAVPSPSQQELMHYQMAAIPHTSVAPLHMDHVNIQPVIAVTQPHVVTIHEAGKPPSPIQSPIQFHLTPPAQQPSPTIVLHQGPALQRASFKNDSINKTRHLTQFVSHQSQQHSMNTQLSQSLPGTQFSSNYTINNPIAVQANKTSEHSRISLTNSLDMLRHRTTSEPPSHFKRSVSYAEGNHRNMMNGGVLDKNANLTGSLQHLKQQTSVDAMKSPENYDDIMDILGDLSTPSPTNIASSLSLSTSNSRMKNENPPSYNSCIFGSSPKQQQQQQTQQQQQQQQQQQTQVNKFLNLNNQNKQFSSVPENMNILGTSPSQNYLSSPFGSLGTNNVGLSGSMNNLQSSNSFGSLNQSSSTGNVNQLHSNTTDNYLSNSPYRSNTPTNFLKMDYGGPMSPMSMSDIGDDQLNMELEQFSPANSSNNSNLGWLDLNLDSTTPFQNLQSKELGNSGSFSNLANTSGMLEMNASMIPQNMLYGGNNSRNQTSIYGSSPQPHDGFVSLYELEGGDY